MSTTEKIQIKSIGLPWICAKNMEKAKAFFHEILGLDIKEENPEFGWMELGAEDGVRLGVGKDADGSELSAGENAIVTMRVEDIVNAKAYLESKDVKFHGEIMEIPTIIKMALFTDPDGNKFQLIQLLENHK